MTVEVGAAAMDTAQLQKIRLSISKNEFAVRFTITGAVMVTRSFEKERKIPMQMKNFVITPSSLLQNSR
jgi:hypothetical protein